MVRLRDERFLLTCLSRAEPIVKQLGNPWEKTFSERLPQVLQGFAKISKELLLSFYKGIERRAAPRGAAVTKMAMLGQQLRNYDALFVDLVDVIINVINTHQREANRAFAPVVARSLASAYEWCAAEAGKPI